jgi:Fe2+ transport system protein FeoA
MSHRERGLRARRKRHLWPRKRRFQQAFGRTSPPELLREMVNSGPAKRALNGSAMPLSMAAAGETVELVKIGEGKRLRKRLADLGLNVGLNVRVIQNCFTGPLILAVKEDSRLAIGRGMAHRILVVPREKV